MPELNNYHKEQIEQKRIFMAFMKERILYRKKSAWINAGACGNNVLQGSPDLRIREMGKRE